MVSPLEDDLAFEVMKTKSGVQKGRELMLSTMGLVWSLPNQPGTEVRSTDVEIQISVTAPRPVRFQLSHEKLLILYC